MSISRSRLHILLPLSILALQLAACRKSDDAEMILISSASAKYDARCQTDTILFNVKGHWTATADNDWLTLPVTEGDAQGESILPLYIQQNDADEVRYANVTITSADGSTLTIPLEQTVPNANGNIAIDLPKNYGLGWGYDLSIDVADIDGLRGQVFDAAALNKYYNNRAIDTSNATHTNLMYESGNSHDELETKISGRLTGKADILVASAKVQAEYSKQINEKKDRRYVWCRDFRQVKLASFSSRVDYFDPTAVRTTATKAFREAVESHTPEELVKKFGTHLVTTSALGGKLDYYFTLSQTVKTETETLITTIQVKVLFVKKSTTSVEEKTWQEIKTDFEANFHIRGGGTIGETLERKLQDLSTKGIMLSASDGPLFQQWDMRFEDPTKVNPDDLVMVDFQVTPIWEIVGALNEMKGKSVKDYVLNTYLKKK